MKNQFGGENTSTLDELTLPQYSPDAVDYHTAAEIFVERLRIVAFQKNVPLDQLLIDAFALMLYCFTMGILKSMSTVEQFQYVESAVFLSLAGHSRRV